MKSTYRMKHSILRRALLVTETHRYDEVFRTTKPDYVPKGYTLVKNLQSFTIGNPLPYGKPEKPKKKSFWERLLG